jgi:branched-subunit amino acid transport protein
MWPSQKCRSRRSNSCERDTWVQRVLRQIPPATLASLVVPALLRPAGHVDVTQARLYAGLVAALVAWRTRSTALTLLVGMGVLLGLQAL